MKTRRLVAALAIPLGITGCVNPTASKIKETRALPSYTAPASAIKPVAPPAVPDTYRYHDSGRSYSLTLKNADLRDVLILLSKESGISIVTERGLRGIVQIEAKNKKLGELLYEILKPLGYTASVENGMILVGRPKLTTRTFRMNYLKDTRNSSSNMNVSGFNAGGSGSVSVSTTGKSDYWGAVENSLEMLVFGTTGMGKRSDGGYIRGEAERKVVAESSVSGSKQTSGNGSRDQTIGKIPISTAVKYGENSNFDALAKSTVQSTEVDDPMLLNTQINENQLKQLVVNEIAGIIQITDYSENLDRIALFLADVEEGSKRQVLIQAHIMEVSLSDSFSMGIDWKTVIDKSTSFSISQSIIPTTSGAASAGSNVFKISATGDNFGTMLDAMKEQGNVNMLSSPKITALNNQKAVIKLTTKEVSWVSSKTTQTTGTSSDTYTTTPQIDEVGIFLDVTPQIGQDGSIIMQIHPSVSEIREMSTSPDKTSTKPVIDVREIDTMVDAKAGETIVIAGLISDKLLESKRGVPLLGDIPYLGALFSYSKQARTKAELVIMMTPYFLNSKTIDEIRVDHEKRMKNIGGDFHLINNIGSMVTEKSSRDRLMMSKPDRYTPAETGAEVPEKTVGAATSTAVTTNQAPPSTQPEPMAKPEQQAPPSGAKSEPQPETSLRFERQQARIIELENEVTATKELLIREKTENELRSAEDRQTADTAKLIQQKSIEELQNNSRTGTVNVPAKNGVQQATDSNRTTAGTVKTVSVTTDREQTLYRSAVTAYKTGNCPESVRAFDALTKTFPDSPFASDAAYYRKDCSDRLASTAVNR